MNSTYLHQASVAAGDKGPELRDFHGVNTMYQLVFYCICSLINIQWMNRDNIQTWQVHVLRSSKLKQNKNNEQKQ